MKKRILVLAIVLIIITLCLFSVNSYAATSGSCGDNVTWELDTATGTLTISGSGDMNNYDYYQDNNAPWYSYKD